MHAHPLHRLVVFADTQRIRHPVGLVMLCIIQGRRSFACPNREEVIRRCTGPSLDHRRAARAVETSSTSLREVEGSSWRQGRNYKVAFVPICFSDRDDK